MGENSSELMKTVQNHLHSTTGQKYRAYFTLGDFTGNFPLRASNDDEAEEVARQILDDSEKSNAQVVKIEPFERGAIDTP